MAAFEWFRSWHGAPMDHKWPVIAEKAGSKVIVVSAIAWALMDYASQHKARGTVEGFDEEAYAVYSGIQESEIHAVIVAMAEKGVIKDGRLANWEKRQPKREDNSANRVAHHREMKRSVTQGNTEGENVTIYSPSPSLSLSDSLNTGEENKASDDFMSTPFTRMNALVSNKIQLTRENSDPERWDNAIDQLVKNEITEEDINGAVKWLTSQNMTIMGAQSIVRACGIEKSKRLRLANNKKNEHESQPTEVFR